MSGSRIIYPEDITELESILLHRIPTYSEISKFNHNQISYFCLVHGYYTIPTQELIDFLKKEIGEAKAIEIGSGNGRIAAALGIPATDSRLQENPLIRTIYASTGQQTVKYGDFVEKLDAVDAVRKHRPEVVIGCWVTQKSAYDKEPQSLYCGIREEKILERCKKYIVVGNKDQHGLKRILKMPHKEVFLEGYVSRAENQNNNIIYIWENL